MTDLRQAAEMVLGSLKDFESDGYMVDGITLGFSHEIEALEKALAEPDTGIDRGAWSDVPDATKWVDELRGDEEWDHPPHRNCDCKFCKEYWSDMYGTQTMTANELAERVKRGEKWDVAEPIGEIQTEQMGANAMRAIVNFYGEPPPVGIKLYAAPPKREWQGLTDEDVEKLCMEFTGQFHKPSFARAIEAKLKEKNT